jgi:hypothetical protein
MTNLVWYNRLLRTTPMQLNWFDIFVLALIVENLDEATQPAMLGVAGAWDGLINRRLEYMGLIGEDGVTNDVRYVTGKWKSVSNYTPILKKLRMVGFLQGEHGNRKPRPVPSKKGKDYVKGFWDNWKSYPLAVPIKDDKLDLDNAIYIQGD